MTASQPATPGSDSVRAQIAEALRIGWRDGAPFVLDPAEGGATRMDFGRYADVLVPLVDRLRAEAKAETLEEAAVELHTDALLRRHDFASYVAGNLRDRAAAYRTNPSSEETR